MGLMLDKILLWLPTPSDLVILSCPQPHECRYLTGEVYEKDS